MFSKLYLKTEVLQKFNSNKDPKIQNYLKKEIFEKNLKLIWFIILNYLELIWNINSWSIAVKFVLTTSEAEVRLKTWGGFLRIHWRMLTILKINKKAYEEMLFDMWKYKCFEIFSNTLYIEMKYEGCKNFLDTLLENHF